MDDDIRFRPVDEHYTVFGFMVALGITVVIVAIVFGCLFKLITREPDKITNETP